MDTNIKIVMTDNGLLVEALGKKYKPRKNESLSQFFTRVNKKANKNATKKGIEGFNFLEEFRNRNFEKVAPQKYKKVSTVSNKLKSKINGTRVAALMFAGMMALSTLTGCAAKSDAKKAENKPAVTQEENNQKEFDKESLQNKSIDELISMLKTDARHNAFTKTNDAYSHFNNKAALSIQTEEERKNNQQLFFNGDESLSAYIYANAETIGADKIADIYGESKVLQTESGRYIELNKETIAAKYILYCMQLSYYYQRGATEASGVSNLFEREDEAQFFSDFEALVLEYNKTKSSQTASEIRSKLEEIYMSGGTDNLMKKYPGASSFIGTAIIPYLYLEDIIDKTMFDSIVEMNETVTCEGIYSQIGNACELIELKESKKVSEEQQFIMETIVKKQNKNTRSLDRNINMMESIEGYSLSVLDDTIINSSGFGTNKTVKRTVTKSKKEAIKKSSEEQVEKAEEEVDKEMDNKTQAEDKKWSEYQAGDSAGYDAAWANLQGGGNGYVNPPAGKSQDYIDGWNNGVKAAKSDWAQAEKDKAEYDKNQENEPPKTEIIEETFVPETPSDQPTKEPETPSDQSTPEAETPSTSSKPITEPTIEIIEETFVYEETQTVMSIERDGVVYETQANTTSKVKSYGAQV